MRYIWILAIAFSASLFAQDATYDADCNDLLIKRMEFLHDGSLTDEAVVVANLELLKPCGLDDFDVSFFGRMEMLSGILHNLTKEKQFELLTYGDWLGDIRKMQKTSTYIKVREMTLASEKLARRPARLETWSKDLQLFIELRASQNVIDKVSAYLQENPDSGKTYREVLELLK